MDKKITLEVTNDELGIIIEALEGDEGDTAVALKTRLEETQKAAIDASAS